MPRNTKNPADLVVRCALDYASKGFRVFPCNWRSGVNFKHPLIANWNEVATADPLQVQAWWISRPQALIGAATGTASGFVALDIDVKNCRLRLRQPRRTRLPGAAQHPNDAHRERRIAPPL